jgi:hypothetical protein
MSTSNSFNFALDRDTIIKRAMHMANIVNLNQASRGDDHAFAVDIFQSMIKLWQAEGIQLWNRRQATLFTAYQDEQYSISASGDHCANTFVDTTISTAEASGQTVLSLTSTTGMTAADNIGIELDDGTRQWTTIVSVDSTTQVTITAALTGAAAAGNTVITYTNKIGDRPLRILDMRRVQLDEQKISTHVGQIGYAEYFNIPLKTTDGAPCNFYYDKLLGAGKLYVFPRPADVNVLLEFTYQEAIEDVDSGTDSVDFPTEWTLPLIYGLAAELMVAYGKFQELPIIQAKADEYKTIARDFDSDEDPLFLLPSGYDNSHYH